MWLNKENITRLHVGSNWEQNLKNMKVIWEWSQKIWKMTEGTWLSHRGGNTSWTLSDKKRLLWLYIINMNKNVISIIIQWVQTWHWRRSRICPNAVRVDWFKDTSPNLDQHVCTIQIETVTSRPLMFCAGLWSKCRLHRLTDPARHSGPSTSSPTAFVPLSR